MCLELSEQQKNHTLFGQEIIFEKIKKLFNILVSEFSDFFAKLQQFVISEFYYNLLIHRYIFFRNNSSGMILK